MPALTVQFCEEACKKEMLARISSRNVFLIAISCCGWNAVSAGRKSVPGNGNSLAERTCKKSMGHFATIKIFASKKKSRTAEDSEA